MHCLLALRFYIYNILTFERLIVSQITEIHDERELGGLYVHRANVVVGNAFLSHRLT